MAFDDTAYERDPHVAGVVIPGLLFIAATLVQLCFQGVSVVIMLVDMPTLADALPIMLVSSIVRGVPALIGMAVGALLLAYAHKGRFALLPSTTPVVCGVAAMVGFGLVAWDFLTCNCLMIGIDVFPAFMSLGATAFYATRSLDP